MVKASIWTIFAGMFLVSCLNLQTVHQFSEEALESTAQLNQLTLSFEQLCQNKHWMQAVRTATLPRSYPPDCTLPATADSALLQMQQVVVDYLNGLSALTSSARTSYSFAPLGQALKQNNLVSIKEEQVNAYQQMAELLTQSAGEARRKKKTATYIAQAHEPLMVLIEQLIFVLKEPLREAARQQQDMLYLQTRELADSAHSFLEKRNLILDYAARSEDYHRQLRLLDTYVALLQNVKEGHRQLYEQRNRLDSDDAIETLSHYTGALYRLQSAFEKIKEQ